MCQGPGFALPLLLLGAFRALIEDLHERLVRRTARGEELLTVSAEIFSTLRAEWASELGDHRMAQIEDDLERMSAGRAPLPGSLPGWAHQL